jgi:chaperonin GroES
METETLEAPQTSAPIGPDPNHPDRITVDRIAVLHDYIVVRPLAQSSRKAGSLMHMPEIAQERERSHRGIVLAVGPGDFNEPGTARVPMSVQVGDLVFYGKFSGTEEELGGRTVLVMRESELRLCAQHYRIVEHENPKFDHLVEDWCDICHGQPIEQAAAERLELERAQLMVQRTAVCSCGHIGDRHAHVTGPCSDCGCMLFNDGTLPATPAAADKPLEEAMKRPCAEPGCLFMQHLSTRVNVESGQLQPTWIGLRCGHEHPAGLATD